jgi:hypothetical protein
MSRTADPGLDDLLTLKDACELVFDGAFTIATLRAEHRKGNLEIYRIGRRDFTTLRDIQEMKKRCRVARRVPASISTRNAGNGLSETEHLSSALAALSQTTQTLKRNSPNTSAASTDQRRARHR